jgi:hypothetical protein
MPAEMITQILQKLVRLKFGAARRAAPTLGLSICEDLCNSRVAPETAEDCRCYNAPSVPPRLRESPCFLKTAETAVLPFLRLWVLAGGFADKTALSNQEEVFWRYSRANWRMVSKRGKTLFFLRLRRRRLGGTGTLDGEFFGH